MAYAMVVDQPVTMEDYRKLLDVVGLEQPAGRIFHAFGPFEGGLRFIDVWESRESARAFERDRLFPAYAQVFGGQAQPPKMSELDVEVYGGPSSSA